MLGLVRVQDRSQCRTGLNSQRIPGAGTRESSRPLPVPGRDFLSDVPFADLEIFQLLEGFKVPSLTFVLSASDGLKGSCLTIDKGEEGLETGRRT